MTELSATPVRRISIITPSLNRLEMLKSAVQSVVGQKYPNYEHIVIDGDSTDGTLEFVKTQPQIRFVGEADHGMYDALNKGLALVSGDVVGFLNTDDLYAEGIFNTIMEMFNDDTVLAVAGKADVFFEGAESRPGIKLYYSPSEQSLLESSTLSGNYFNAWFFRHTVFDLIGGFNPMYKVAGDRDFMLRLALNNVPFKTIDKLAYLYRSHAGSLTFDSSEDKQMLTASEHVKMTTYYLANQNLTAIEKRLIAQFHTRESLALARLHERSGNIREYLSLLADCIKYNPYAFSRVLRHVTWSIINQSGRLVRYVGKKFTLSN